MGIDHFLGLGCASRRRSGTERAAAHRKARCGQHHKDDGGDKDLVEDGDLGGRCPGPQHRHCVGDDVGQSGEKLALPPEHAGNQSGEAKGHAVKGCASGGQIPWPSPAATPVAAPTPMPHWYPAIITARAAENRPREMVPCRQRE